MPGNDWLSSPNFDDFEDPYEFTKPAVPSVPAQSEPRPASPPIPVGPTSAQPSRPVTVDAARPAAPVRRSKSGAVIGTLAIVLGALGSAVCAYGTLDALDIFSVQPWSGAGQWFLGFIVSVGVALVGLLTVFVVLVRRSAGTRTAATGMGVAFLVWPVLTFVGVSAGISSVTEHLRDGAAGATSASVIEYAEDNDIDLGPAQPFFEWFADS